AISGLADRFLVHPASGISRHDVQLATGFGAGGIRRRRHGNMVLSAPVGLLLALRVAVDRPNTRKTNARHSRHPGEGDRPIVLSVRGAQCGTWGGYPAVLLWARL